MGEPLKALRAILAEIEKLEKGIEECEAILDAANGYSDEQREKARLCIREKKRQLRNIKSGLRGAIDDLPLVLDPRHR